MPQDRSSDPSDEPIASGDPIAPEEQSGYDAPPELDSTGSRSRTGDDEGPGAGPPGPRRPLGLQLGLAVALIALVGGALLAYRAHHRARTLADGITRAEALLRLDTAAGYRAAADLLVPLTEWDPLEAGSRRAFALAMLAADYRDEEARRTAQALLVEPGRAEQVPTYANLAAAALFLGRRAVGDAANYAGRARTHPWGATLMARLALMAGNLEAGLEPAATAVGADPGLAAGQAVQGDLARRARGDVAAARAGYAAALAVSPRHPRATYGLAKLALAGQIPLGEAVRPLRDLLDDAAASPAPERGRAAIYLAAIQLRGGDQAGSAAALDAANLDGAARTWAGRAAAVLSEERRPFRAVFGAPPTLLSASDDDPAELSPEPPPPPPPPPPPKVKVAAPKKAPVKKVVAATVRKSTSPAAKKATTTRKVAPKKPSP